MENLPDKTFCYKHKNKETKLSCTECGRYICYNCIVQLPVGQKCPDCLKSKVTHLEKISSRQYLVAIIVALVVASLMGYLFNLGNNFGFFYQLIFAYVVGFIVSKSICKAIGYKISKKIQLIVVTSIFIGFFIDPINVYNLLIDFGNQINIFQLISHKTDVVKATSFIVASWAAMVHLRW